MGVRITTQMLLQLEKAIAPDAQAEILIYPAGMDIRVSWKGGLRLVNQNLGVVDISTVAEFKDEKTEKAWQKLIAKFQRLRDQKP
ncbi:unnamed protein product [Ectocarpus fasciculatus]